MGVKCCVPLLVLFAAVAARAEGPEFGQAVAGLRIAVEVSPTDWRPNSRVEFACTVQNVSQQPIRAAAWGLDLAQAIEIRDASGRVVAFEGGRDETARVPRDAIAALAPGEARRFVLRGRISREGALVVRELLGGAWTWSLREGSYSVRAVFEKRDSDRWAKSLQKGGYWTGKALSPAARVTMAGEALEPGEAVADLKLKLSAENTDLRMVDDGAGGWRVAPAKIELSFVNDGNEPIKVNTRGLAQGLVRLEVDGPDDDSLRMTRLDAPAGRGETDVMVLDPGTGWTSQAPFAFPGRFGGVSYEILKPGRYSVTAIYSSSAKGFWTGVVQSNVVVFNVMGGPTPAGVPVKGLKIALSTDTPEILIDGDPAKLTITFTNVGAEPIKLDTYDLFWSRLRLAVVAPDGKPLKAAVIQALRDMPGPAEIDYPTLEPSKSWSAKSQPLFPGLFGARNFAIAQPGEYRLRVTYENKPPAKEGEVDPFAKGSWTGLVTSSELTINVIGLPRRPK